jgi:hypothetical protein
MDIFFNNVGEAKLLRAISRSRVDLTEVWPRITTDRGAWAIGDLLLVVVATMSLVGYLFWSSRWHGEQGRPWLLEGASPSGKPLNIRWPGGWAAFLSGGRWRSTEEPSADREGPSIRHPR